MKRNRRPDLENDDTPSNAAIACCSLLIVSLTICVLVGIHVDFLAREEEQRYFEPHTHTEPQPEPPPEIVKFLGEADLPPPDSLLGTRISLNTSATVGQYLHILGNTTKNATSFCVTLAEDYDDDENIACNVCAYFGADPRIVYGAYRDGKRLFSGKDFNPFTTGEQFDLRIRFLQDYVQIFAQRGEIGIFGKLPEVHEAKSLKVIGDVTNLLLIQVEGGSYTTPFYQRINFDSGLRIDMVLKPVPEVDPSLWKSLIEGQPIENSTSIRVKRKGGSGGSRGSSAARMSIGSRSSSRSGSSWRSSSSYSRSSSGSNGQSYGGGSYSSYKPSPRFTSFRRRPTYVSGHGTSYGRSTMGVYLYSPAHGGYYHPSPSHSVTSPTAHFYSPASYSYRNPQKNGTMEYSLSDGHGLTPDPNNVVDPKLIPKPKRIEIMFYSYGPDLRTGDWGLSPNFRISFQFDKNVTVLDHPTEFFGSLGEERADFVPMDDWRLFDLVIRCVNRRLRLYINNYEFANYELGRSIEGTDHIGVTGDVEVLGFTGNTLVGQPGVQDPYSALKLLLNPKNA